MHRLFAEAEPVEAVKLMESPSAPIPEAPNDTPDTGVGPGPPETVALWVELVVTIGPDELADFEERTFRQGARMQIPPNAATLSGIDGWGGIRTLVTLLT